MGFYHAYNNAIGKPYLMDFVQFAIAEFSNNTEPAVFLTPQKFFCSSLAVYIYKCVGVLPYNLDPERITPSELFEKDIIDKNNIGEIKFLMKK